VRWRVTIFGIVVAAAVQIPLLQAEAGQWLSEREPELGFAFSYPAGLFHEIEGDGKPSFHYFASGSSGAKFLVGGWDNRAQQTPDDGGRSWPSNYLSTTWVTAA
jgi:hypothetical protein